MFSVVELLNKQIFGRPLGGLHSLLITSFDQCDHIAADQHQSLPLVMDDLMSKEGVPRAYRLKKRACNCTPIKIQTKAKNGALASEAARLLTSFSAGRLTKSRDQPGCARALWLYIYIYVYVYVYIHATRILI